MATSATASMARSPQKTVFVTGANGYIGSAICRAFVRAGWRTYGLVRKPEAADDLLAEEIIPVIGSVSADLAYLGELTKETKTFDVIVSCTEQFPFVEHYEHLIALIKQLATTSNQNGVKPLLLMTSGCKDYGNGGKHGSPGLAPHTEESPLQPIDLVKERTYCTLKVFEHSTLFDAAVIRPTPVFGYSSSYYGVIFDVMNAIAQTRARARGGEHEEEEEEAIRIADDFDNIIHGCHVDDCAEAYVALATHRDRSTAVAGQCFNVSAHRYETVRDFADALEGEYRLPDGSIHGGSGAGPSDSRVDGLSIMFVYSQWVDSSKLRQLTGWTDKRRLPTENIRTYRLAYEAAVQRRHGGVERTRGRVRVELLSKGFH